jgi:DNA-binding XRE family transcriptional regulator
MRIKNTQTVSKAIREGRQKQNVTQAEAANILGISRTKLVAMELDHEALGSASFFSVMKAIKLAGLELYLEEKPKPRTLTELQADMKLKMDERFKGDEDQL